MKKLLKVLLISLVAVMGALCLFACTTPDNGGNNGGNNGGTTTGIELPGKIEGDTGEYTNKYTTAYGEEPDLDNVIIDGVIDDELWEGKKWYSQYQNVVPTFKFEFTATMSEGGLYVAARSDDRYIFWTDRNKHYANTYIQFKICNGIDANGNSVGRSKTIDIDANNTKPTGDLINIRSTYKGTINDPGRSKGLFMEAYFTWEQLGMDEKPAQMRITPIYYYKVGRSGNSMPLYNTFLFSNANDVAAPLFDETGYIDADAANATVGTHDTGLAKTTGWKVENAGTEDETMSVDAVTAGANYTPKNVTQAAFFKGIPSATRFKISTKVTVHSTNGYTRAGLLIFNDRLNYRAYGLEIGENFNSSKGKFTDDLSIKAWTNFPYDIVTPTDMGKYDINYGNADALGLADNEAYLTVFGNAGNLYYLLNGQYIFSENAASYVPNNSYLGIYAYNSSVSFTDYEAEVFETQLEFDEAIAPYVYTVDVFNESDTVADVTLSQIAAPQDGTGSVDVIGEYAVPAKMSGKMYESKMTYLSYFYTPIDGPDAGVEQEVVLFDSANGIAEVTSKAGIVTINNIPANIIIDYRAERVEMTDYVEYTLSIVNGQTQKPAEAVGVLFTSDDGEYTRYNTSFYSPITGVQTYVLPAGKVWNVHVEGEGYRPIDLQINGGEAITANNGEANAEKIDLTAAILGGTATDANDVAVGISTTGIYWDLTEEANNKVVFTSTNTGSSYIYFSGPTVSDYQVAYIEVTNQTDYTAFRSIEDDPAVGFCIKGQRSGVVSRALWWKDGVRIISNPSLSWNEGVKSIGCGAGYPGRIAHIDRNNGGAVTDPPTMGSGSINRVPYGEETYTTSCLMIRRGGNVYMYSANGRAGVKQDGTNMDNMKMIYSYYNELNTGAAAVGLAITVSYNLRIDFENYWIISGDEAAAFADDLIKANYSVSGPDANSVKVESDGLFEGEDGVVALQSQVNVSYDTANGPFPANKLLKITLPDGTVKLISSANDVATFQVTKADINWNVHAEFVDATKYTGKVKVPQGIDPASLSGVVLGSDGKEINKFNVDGNGNYTIIVETGKTYSIKINLSGYASDQPEFTAGVTSSIPDIEMQELNIFGSGADSRYTFGNDDQLGIYARYYADGNTGNAALPIRTSAKEDFVFEYSYIRTSKANTPGASSDDEKDMGIGIRISGNGDQIQFMQMGDGYRILTNHTSWDTRIENRGKGGANTAAYDVSYDKYITIKYVKVGGVMYMYNRYSTDPEGQWRLLDAFTMRKSSTDSTPICTGAVSIDIWMTTSGDRFLDYTVFDIKVSDVNKETAPDLFGKVTYTAPDEGRLEVTKASGAILTNDAEIKSGDVLTITATPVAGRRVKTLKINGIAVSLGAYNSGVLTYKHTATGNVNVEVEWEDAAHVIELDVSADGITVTKVEIIIDGVTTTYTVGYNPNGFSATKPYFANGVLKIQLPEKDLTLKLYNGNKLEKTYEHFDVLDYVD